MIDPMVPDHASRVDVGSRHGEIETVCEVNPTRRPSFEGQGKVGWGGLQGADVEAGRGRRQTLEDEGGREADCPRAGDDRDNYPGGRPSGNPRLPGIAEGDRSTAGIDVASAPNRRPSLGRTPTPSAATGDDVFINCPFDTAYQPLFNAILFTVQDCGFRPRCALEVEDSSQVRIDKLFSLIGECPLGIHDISRTELDHHNNLPRFNMPLELGIFLGAKRFGPPKQQAKKCVILDRDPYRFQQFCSDIAGQDVQSHRNDPIEAIRILRNWLQSIRRRDRILIPGADAIASRHLEFQAALPDLCRRVHLTPDGLIYADRTTLISEWLKLNPW
jgi:hypothetical protein